MPSSRSALSALLFASAALVAAGCDQVSQRLTAPTPRQPAAPVAPVTIQPVPNATPAVPADAPAVAPAHVPADRPGTGAPPAAQSTRQPLPAQPDQETLSTARLRQSSPLAAPPGGTTTDRNQDR
ncbi:MAG TPA: hypothetical protein VLA31_06285 [Burkholderiaceae bacterium]|nr:hypothetical protein [Burkholderiaceae bacterium]